MTRCMCCVVVVMVGWLVGVGSGGVRGSSYVCARLFSCGFLSMSPIFGGGGAR